MAAETYRIWQILYNQRRKKVNIKINNIRKSVLTFIFSEALTIKNANNTQKNLLTFPEGGLEGQEWNINYDGSITNPFFNLTVDIKGGLNHPGSEVIGWKKNNQKNQVFEFLCS